jgi:hypothetical protein
MQSQSRRFYLLSVILCTAAIGVNAQSPTSFLDGTWKLNAAKSEAGPRPLPSLLTIKVTSKGPEFEGLQTTDEGEVLLKFRSDGKEMVNQLPGGVEMRSKHRVENRVLFAEYRIVMPQTEFEQTDRIEVSADGKSLTTDREVKTAQGNFKLKMVFDRQ